jgi:predicted transposase YbfD/YdcC
LRTTSILTRSQLWEGLSQAFCLTRERTVRGQKTVEAIYGITSLSPHKASAARLLKITRDHWTIENELHYVRDGTLKEDACRVRSGSAPQVLAAFRNCVVHLLSQVESRSCPEAIELLQMNPERARELIGVPKCE